MAGPDDERERRARNIQGFLLVVFAFVALATLVVDTQPTTKIVVCGFFLINLAMFIVRAPKQKGTLRPDND